MFNCYTLETELDKQERIQQEQSRGIFRMGMTMKHAEQMPRTSRINPKATNNPYAYHYHHITFREHSLTNNKNTLYTFYFAKSSISALFLAKPWNQ